MEDLSLDFDKKKDPLQETLEKVRWSSIMAPEIRLGGHHCFFNCFTLEADAGFLLNTPSANSFSSTYRESSGDRAFTCRTHNKGDISGNDFSIAAGYALSLCPQVKFTTLVGYAEHRRRFHLHPKAMKTSCEAESDPQKVNLSTLHYSARWQGPWAGFRIGYSPFNHLHLVLDAEYHYTLLTGKGKWHLKEHLSDGYDFDSRVCAKHYGNGPGVKVNAGIVHELCHQWKLVLHGYYTWICNKKGKNSTVHNQIVSKPDQKPISQGSFLSTPRYRTQLNAWALLGGVDYEF